MYAVYYIKCLPLIAVLAFPIAVFSCPIRPEFFTFSKSQIIQRN